MLLVSAFGCGSMTGISSGYLSLKKTLDVYMREGGYPDAVVTTDVTKRSQMDTLRALDGIAAVNARLVGDGFLISPEGRYLLDCGGNAFTLQKLLGHSTLEMTRKYCELFNADIVRDYDSHSPLSSIVKPKKSIKMN